MTTGVPRTEEELGGGLSGRKGGAEAFGKWWLRAAPAQRKQLQP